MKESPKRNNTQLDEIIGSGKESIYLKSKLSMGVLEPGAKGTKLK